LIRRGIIDALLETAGRDVPGSGSSQSCPRGSFLPLRARSTPASGSDADASQACTSMRHRRSVRFAIATVKCNVFVNKDRGQTWSQIAKEGAGNG
jgi:hypothetical protein